ncbi:MAG: hypothetical protein UHD09_05095 [Bifidobacterium sp.]|nr:hypothetical protein [Bifidobacterium sp.]
MAAPRPGPGGWSTLIFGWWFCASLITQTITERWLPWQVVDPITIQRTTGSYHGWMALILFVGYAGVVIWNLGHQLPAERVRIGWLLACGILIQFAWEVALLLGGIRSAGMTLAEAVKPLVVNSLLETNLGMPYVYLIFLAVPARRHEDLSPRRPPVGMLELLRESNAATGRRGPGGTARQCRPVSVAVSRR